MKLRVALRALVIMSCFALPHPSAEASAGLESRQAPETVEASARRFIVAFNNLDMPAFLDCFADDATIIHPPSGPPRTFPKRVQGKSEIQRTFQVVFDLIRGGRTTGPYQDLQPRDLLVQAYDGLAVVTFHLGTDARVGRRTLVFRRMGSNWKIVHLHASIFEVSQP